MTDPSSAARRRVVLCFLIAGAALLVAGANAHLVYVASSSQPDCVVHVRLGDSGAGQFSAAQSACSSR